MIKVNNAWQAIFDEEQKKDYYLALRKFLISEYRNHTIYPPMNEIFRAFEITDFNSVKVIIVGQDPYHEENQAMGLSFSVKEDCPDPPSLVNIHKELVAEGYDSPWSSDLTRWARQGVLLINSTLTVRAHQALSHTGYGWERFTDNAIEKLSEDARPKVFMLWGSYARGKKALIKNKAHLILESAHPSPLSAYRGFFGNGHFKKANEFLSSSGQEEIIW